MKKEILQCTRPFTVRSFALGDVQVREAQHDGEAVRVSFPGHLVSLGHSERTIEEQWDGNKLPWRTRPTNAITFVPKNTLVQARMAPGAYGSTMVMLDDRLFSRTVAGHIDYSRIDFRYDDVSGPLALSLIKTIREFTVADEMSRWPLMVESASIALVMAIIRALSPDASTVLGRLPNGLGSERRRRVVEYIEDNLRRPITIAEMAEVAFLSPFHFVRSFSKAVGETPLRYVARRRMEEAQKLLRDSQLSIADVAHACGYSSQSHMTTVFKRIAGITPGGYRRGAVGVLLAGLGD